MKIITVLIFLFQFSQAMADHGPVYSYQELSRIVGHKDVWDAYKDKKISYEEVMALSSYVSYDDPIYPEINEYLRFGKIDDLYYFQNLEELKTTISHMDSGISKLASLPSNLLSFRGVTFKYRNNECYKIGDTFIDQGYGSTSVSHSIAESFSGSLSEEIKSSGVLYLYSNYSHPGILINPLEDEVLLPRNLKFKVMDRIDQGRTCRLLVQICVKDCSRDISRPEVSQVWKKFFQK